MKMGYNMEHDSDEEVQYESDTMISDEEEEYYDDYEDYDDFDDFNNEDTTKALNPLLKEDIEKVKEIYGEDAITYQHHAAIGDIDVELHIPGSHFDYEIAKAWKILLDEDIIVRLQMDPKHYLDSEVPKVQVFQPSQKVNFGIGIQVKEILLKLLANEWHTSAKQSAFVEVSAGFENLTVAPKPGSSKVPQVSAGTSGSKGAKCVPSRGAGFLAMVYGYYRQRLDSLNEFCVVCDKPHVFQNGATMLKPAVCGRDLCVFAFQTLGVMSKAADEVSTSPEVVDLLVTMAKAACKSARRNIILDPFPSVVDPRKSDQQQLALTPNDKDYKLCEKALKPLDMHKLSAYQGTNLKKILDEQNILSFPLLQWLISSNRSHIVKLPKERQMSFMGTPHQFLLLNSPPAKEALFKQYKKKHGSTFAFHGSAIENWHSILRNGLMNASGTTMQCNGARYGGGIYLSPTASVSLNYMNSIWSDSKVCLEGSSAPVLDDRFLNTNKGLACMALCEVINTNDLKKKGDIWVMPNADKVCTRFFFIYENRASVNSDINTVSRIYRRAIEEAVAFQYC